MRWVMDVCPNTLSWQTWLILCSVVVVLWAGAIAGATVLFHASPRPRPRPRRSERREAMDESVRSGPVGAD